MTKKKKTKELEEKKDPDEQKKEMKSENGRIRYIKNGSSAWCIIVLCHHCDSTNTKTYHKRGNIRYYKCKNCNYTFKEALYNPLTKEPI